MKPKNVIVWFDLPTLDFDRAKKFYEAVLGDEIKIDEQTGMKVGMFPMQEKMGVGGDLVPPDSPMMIKPAPAGLGARMYFDVSDRLDEAIEQAEIGGGKIIRPKFFMEMAGWMAIIEDTEGNQVGLWSKGKKEDSSDDEGGM